MKARCAKCVSINTQVGLVRQWQCVCVCACLTLQQCVCVPEAGHGAVDQEAGQHGGQAVPGEAVAPQVGAQHRAVVWEHKHTSRLFRKSQGSKRRIDAESTWRLFLF